MTPSQQFALGAALLFVAAVCSAVAIVAAPVWFLASAGAAVCGIYGALLVQEARQ